MVDVKKLIDDFLVVARIAGAHVSECDFTIESLQPPHVQPKRLPSGKAAVYCFFDRDTCLKVGKVGPKSNARYTSQHYNPASSLSNLAKSLLKSQRLQGIDETTVGNWIRQHTRRVNILVDARVGRLTLNLLEAFLQCRLCPEFEGSA